jgi:hypothetical protein
MKYPLLLFLITITVYGTAQVTISGRIKDANTGEMLIAAHCTDSISKRSVVSNKQGFYSLTLNGNKAALRVHYVGYELAKLDFSLKADTVIDFNLFPKDELIDEVKVVADIPIHEQTLLGKNVVSVDAIENGPSSFGMSDLMKAVTVLPGISMGREGRSNFYVRGGDRGQNLILLDGAKLYNTNHLGGFVSLFNTDVIKQVDVYKGGFPARYGGRVSSVIDIYSRDGSRNKIKGKFNLGLLTSGILAEGPIGHKVSFLVAARTSYYDLFSLPQRRKMKRFAKAYLFTFRFYDINAKLSYFINPRNKIFLNYFNGADRYISKDRYGSSSNSSTVYGLNNHCVTLGHDVSIGPRSFLKNSATYSTYNNELDQSIIEKDDGIENVYRDNSSSKIMEYNLKSHLEYYPDSYHAIKTGIEFSNYHFNPGRAYTFQSKSNTGFEIDSTIGYTALIRANELSFFVEDEISLSSKINVNLGLREVVFMSEGKNYYRTEPRISLRMMLSNNLSLKASYTIMNQFNHVLVSNYGLFEKEIWMASTKDIPPQHASQYSAGLFATIPAFKVQLSAEGYYKKMTNLLEYVMPVDGDLVVTDINENIVTGGTGEAYGLEFQSKYKNQFFSIDLAYVLSWNYRQFDEVNNGKRYPFIYDRRHDFSLLFSSMLSKHYTVNANFVFSTGIPCTMPVGYVKRDDFVSYNYYAYQGINDSRMPNYHRLDLALIKKGITRNGREKTFKINVFNAYARKNPVLIYYDQKTNNVFGKSMFSIVPTVSYSLQF